MLYNILWISAVQQCESAISIYIPLPLDAPPPTLTRSVGVPALRVGVVSGPGFWELWQPQDRGLDPPLVLCLDAGSILSAPTLGGSLMHSSSLRASLLLSPAWGSGGGLGVAGGLASLPTSLQIPAASTDTLLTGMDWLGLAEGSLKRGHCQAAGGVAWGQGPSSQQQILCTVFSIPVFE